MKARYKKSEAVKQLEKLAFKTLVLKNPSFPYPPKKKYRDNTSNDLTRCVTDWIKLNGYQSERINSTGRVLTLNGQPKWIKGSSTNGTSDISATILGRSIKIEIKCEATKDNYQSDDQKKYQKQIENAGGIYIIVRNFSQFHDWYHSFIKSVS
jgi:hypothetical protein